MAQSKQRTGYRGELDAPFKESGHSLTNIKMRLTNDQNDNLPIWEDIAVPKCTSFKHTVTGSFCDS